MREAAIARDLTAPHPRIQNTSALNFSNQVSFFFIGKGKGWQGFNLKTKCNPSPKIKYLNKPMYYHNLDQYSAKFKINHNFKILPNLKNAY